MPSILAQAYPLCKLLKITLTKRRGIEMKLVIGDAWPARVDQTLLKAFVRAHKWFHDWVSGRAQNMAEIASRESQKPSSVLSSFVCLIAPSISSVASTFE